METSRAETIIVGASAAGLAVGACLQRAGVPFVLLEQSDRVASVWRRHYERLHLHTSRGLSGLPFMSMPRTYPRYPSRAQVVEYLESYARQMGLKPRFGQRVESIERRNGHWVTRTASDSWESNHVVVATGYTRRPYRPTWPGMDEYDGALLHSAEYDSGRRFVGRRVLVVGFGNSGGEIAIDLIEQGAQATLSVRSEVNVVPRDLLGIPILGWGLVLRLLPAGLADLVSKPLLRASVGNIQDVGLRTLGYGPNTQIRKHGRIPLLDIGTLERMRRGDLAVRPGIDRFSPSGVIFTDATEESFDAVVLATGYRPQLADFLRVNGEVLDDRGLPRVSGAESAAQGLFFCGFYVSPTGMLREIGREARRIARILERRTGTSGSSG